MENGHVKEKEVLLKYRKEMSDRKKSFGILQQNDRKYEKRGENL